MLNISISLSSLTELLATVVSAVPCPWRLPTLGTDSNTTLAKSILSIESARSLGWAATARLWWRGQYWCCQSSSQGTFFKLHSSNSTRLVAQVSHTHCLTMLSLIAAICGLVEGWGPKSKAWKALLYSLGHRLCTRSQWHHTDSVAILLNMNKYKKQLNKLKKQVGMTGPISTQTRVVGIITDEMHPYIFHRNPLLEY